MKNEKTTAPMHKRLQAPFPWFGGKSRAAHLVWPRFGYVPNYVEPFFGSGADMVQPSLPEAGQHRPPMNADGADCKTGKS